VDSSADHGLRSSDRVPHHGGKDSRGGLNASHRFGEEVDYEDNEDGGADEGGGGEGFDVEGGEEHASAEQGEQQ
jgi:hypothetical protein